MTAAFSVHGLISERARRELGGTISDGLTTLTAAELDDHAGRLASRLRRLGVGPEVLVGVHLHRSVDVLVALLGTLKAGGAFVPLEPGQPAQRLALMLNDANPRVIVTSAALARQLPKCDARVLLIDSDRAGWMAEAPARGFASGPSDLAYVMFTSGSTGEPKGVMVEHGALLSHLRWRVEALEVTPADHLLHKTNLGFDPALWELFGPLLGGASLTILGRGDHTDPRRLARAVEVHRITVLGFVPSMLEEFVAVAAAEPSRLDSLRLVTCGGESLKESLVRSFLQRFPEVALCNMYGPTEAVIAATWWRCHASGAGPVPIGLPVDGTEVHIVDGALRVVAGGEAGELCIAGSQLARGYLHRPELTAERFVADPVRASERWYRTGDLARRRADGAIEFLGRLDHQVKIRGNRIECGEVESALLNHPALTDAAVLARDVGARGQVLVAYLVCAAGVPAPGLAELRTHLSGRLPEYMVPAAFVVLDALPRSLNGKLDRTALPGPDANRLGSDSPYAAPQTEPEVALAAIWEEVLLAGRVGRHDNFFDLGGDSITAIRLSARAHSAGLRIDPEEVFEHQTVASLAAAARPAEPGGERWWALAGVVRPPLEARRPTPRDFPLAEVDQETLDRLLG